MLNLIALEYIYYKLIKILRLFQHSDLVDITNNTIGELDKNKLPTRSNILRLLFHKTRKDNLEIESSIKLILNDVIEIWSQVPLKTIQFNHSAEKLRKLYKEF